MSATDEQKIRHEFDVRFILEDQDDLAAATDVLDQLLRTMKSEAAVDARFSNGLRKQPRIMSATEMPVYYDGQGDEVHNEWEL